MKSFRLVAALAAALLATAAFASSHDSDKQRVKDGAPVYEYVL